MAGKGGKRAGAGRPKRVITQAKKDLSSEILASVNQKKIWRELLNSKDPKIKMDAVKYLTDRAHGRARESVKVSGDAENPLVVTVRHIGTDN